LCARAAQPFSKNSRNFTLRELVALHEEIAPLIATADPHQKAQLLALRGQLNGRRGNWSQAAEDFGAVVEVIADDHLNWYRGPVLRAWLGDREGYGRFCREMLDRFSREETPAFNEGVAKTCFLRPLPAGELERAYRLIDQAAVKAENHWVRPWVEATQSLADYRRAGD
jgi:hypothetical protein